MEEQWTENGAGGDESGKLSSRDESKIPAGVNSLDVAAFAAATSSSSDDFEAGPVNPLSPNSSINQESSDLDQKPPARNLEQHPYDILSPGLFNSSGRASLEESDDSSPLNSHTSDPADQFRMDLMPPSYTTSSPAPYAYHPGYFIDQQYAGASSPDYLYSHYPAHVSAPFCQETAPPVVYSNSPFRYINAPTTFVPSHASSSHEADRQIQSRQPTTSAVGHPPDVACSHVNSLELRYEDVREMHRRQPTTSTGEHSSQFRRGPSEAELESCKTPRARAALKTWYKRLEDLYRYRLEQGNCKTCYSALDKKMQNRTN